MILAIKTDVPSCEMSLLSPNGQLKASEVWLAERRLAKELLGRLETFLASHGTDFKDLSGLIVFSGPGSYTGLRIGITVMNTLAFSLEIPIVGAEGESWLKNSATLLANGENDKIVLPEYGAPAHITQPKK